MMDSNSQKLIPKKDDADKQQLIMPDEKPIRENSDSEEEERTPMVPPKKPNFTPTRRGLVPEPAGDASECSSPSPSGFIIMPASKPRAKKAASAPQKFSPEEEIALLKGLAAFWANGRNNKWTEFHLFVKDDLPRQLTKIQVSEKIRGLKRKFDTNLRKARANGGQLDFSDHHESLLFELSKRLWEEDNDTTGGKVENGHDEKKEKKTPIQREDKKTLVKKEEKKNIASKTIKKEGNNNGGESYKLQKRKRLTEISIDEFAADYPLLCGSFDVFGYPKFAKDWCTLIGKEKAQYLEVKWRELYTEELQLEVKRIDLIKRDLLDHHTNK